MIAICDEDMNRNHLFSGTFLLANCLATHGSPFSRYSWRVMRTSLTMSRSLASLAPPSHADLIGLLCARQ